MLHRPTLMPASMRSANKTCNLSKSTDYADEIADSNPLLSSFLDDDEIVVVEPTDPDEDRLKEEARIRAENNISCVDFANPSVQYPTSPTQTAVLDSTPVLSELPTSLTTQSGSQHPSTEARITISTDPDKPVSVIPLNETLQSILTSTNRINIPNVSVQPIISAKIAPTTYVIPSSIGTTLWVQSPIQNNNVTITPNNLVNTNQTVQVSAPVNPLFAAILVNCASLNMMNQLTGSLNSSQTPSTSESNIMISQPLTGSVVPNLLSTGLSLPTPLTMLPPNTGSIFVPTGLQTKLLELVPPKPNVPNNQVNKFKLVENRLIPRAGRVKRFKCPIPNCEMTFYSRFNQTEHIRCHTGERPFRCPEPNCRAAFKRKRDLRDHWNMHLVNRPLTCATLEEEFEKALKEASERSESGDKPEPVKPTIQTIEPLAVEPTAEPTPKLATKESEHKAFVTASNKSDIGYRRYECAYPGCYKSYARRHRLNQHFATHNGPGPVSCDQPSYRVRYFSEDDLRRHLYISDKNVRRKHGCPYPNCDKSYSKLNKLKEHLRSHTGERPYVCREPGCGASFVRLYGVKRHEMTHAFGRKRAHRLARFPTTLAKVINGTAFDNNGGESVTSVSKRSDTDPIAVSDSNGLTVPSVEVIQIAPSTAKSDPGVSSASRQLPVIAPRTTEIRMRPISPIHGTPGVRRPHVCPFKECGRAFPKLNKLREHICRHTGERPFACDKCPASFVRVYDLRRHSDIHLRKVETRIQSRPLAPRDAFACTNTPNTSLTVGTASPHSTTDDNSPVVKLEPQ